MFGLSDADLARNILGVADGPASFNAEMHALGHRVTSVDPIYVFETDAIRRRFDETEPMIRHRVEEHPDHYTWRDIKTGDDLIALRRQALDLFLADLPAGRAQGRYLPAQLPHLPFPDRAFDLCLCSHLLFTYHEHLDLAFHRAALRELLRVSREVRLYPLIGLDGAIAPTLSPLLDEFGGDLIPTTYEHQRGATHHYRLRSP